MILLGMKAADGVRAFRDTLVELRRPVLSIGLGGGSRVRQAGEFISVGPDSVGFRLRSEGLVFGGSTLTATDIAVAGGIVTLGNGAAVRHLARGLVLQALQQMGATIEDAIDRMKTSASAVPVVLVGGGSILAPTKLRGASEVIVPKQAGVANAIGAAIAKASGEVDQVYSYEQLGRDIAVLGTAGNGDAGDEQGGKGKGQAGHFSLSGTGHSTGVIDAATVPASDRILSRDETLCGFPVTGWDGIDSVMEESGSNAYI